MKKKQQPEVIPQFAIIFEILFSPERNLLPAELPGSLTSTPGSATKRKSPASPGLIFSSSSRTDLTPGDYRIV